MTQQATMYLLTQRWTQPCSGSTVYMIDLTDEETNRLREVLAWLEEKAGDDYGHTLSEWDLFKKEHIRGEADHTGIDAVLSMLALESRYNEIPGEPGSFYGGQHPELEGEPK